MYKEIQKILQSNETSETSKSNLINELFSKINRDLCDFTSQCESFFKNDQEFSNIKKEKENIEKKAIGVAFVMSSLGLFAGLSGYEMLQDPLVIESVSSLPYGMNAFFDDLSEDLGYFSSGFGGVLTGGIVSTLFLMKGKFKSRIDKLKNMYKEKEKERIQSLGEQTFTLTPSQIKTIDTVSLIIFNNSFLKELLFKNTQEDFVSKEMNNALKYEISELFITNNWTKDAKLIFLVEYLKEIKKRDFKQKDAKNV